VSGDLPVQLATHFADWSAGGLLRCSAARLSVCRVVLQIPRVRDTQSRTTCCGHPPEEDATKMPSYDDATMKLLTWNVA